MRKEMVKNKTAVQVESEREKKVNRRRSVNLFDNCRP